MTIQEIRQLPFNEKVKLSGSEIIIHQIDMIQERPGRWIVTIVGSYYDHKFGEGSVKLVFNIRE
jgi:hypothetical protein